MVTINYIFAHWIKEIVIRKLGDNLQRIPSLPVDIYRYSNAMLKLMSKDALKICEDILIYSKEKLAYAINIDRR